MQTQAADLSASANCGRGPCGKRQWSRREAGKWVIMEPNAASVTVSFRKKTGSHQSLGKGTTTKTEDSQAEEGRRYSKGFVVKLL